MEGPLANSTRGASPRVGPHSTVASVLCCVEFRLSLFAAPLEGAPAAGSPRGPSCGQWTSREGDQTFALPQSWEPRACGGVVIPAETVGPRKPGTPGHPQPRLSRRGLCGDPPYSRCPRPSPPASVQRKAISLCPTFCFLTSLS